MPDQSDDVAHAVSGPVPAPDNRPAGGAIAAAGTGTGRFSRQPAPGRSRNRRAARAGSAPEPGGPARKRARMSWKATEEEQAMPLPGDDLVPSPVVQTTHAVTINAAPQQVWPWLVQTGQGRAGFSLRLPVLGPVGGLVLPPPVPAAAREACSRLSRRRRRPDRSRLAESARGRRHRRRPAGDGLLRRAASRTRQVMGPVHRHAPAVPAAGPPARRPPAGRIRRAQRQLPAGRAALAPGWPGSPGDSGTATLPATRYQRRAPGLPPVVPSGRRGGSRSAGRGVHRYRRVQHAGTSARSSTGSARCGAV